MEHITAGKNKGNLMILDKKPKVLTHKLEKNELHHQKRNPNTGQLLQVQRKEGYASILETYPTVLDCM